MQHGKWNQYDFLTCLEVMPEDEDYGFRYTYRISRAGMKLIVGVVPHMDMVQIALAQEEAKTYLMRFDLLVRGEVLHQRERSQEWLEFHDCVVLSAASWGRDPKSEALQNVPGFRVQLSIKPYVKVCLEDMPR